MRLVKLKEGEYAIDPRNTETPIDIFILVTGRIKYSKYIYEELALEEKEGIEGETDKLTFQMSTKIIHPPEIFGDFSSLDRESWDNLFAYAYEGTADLIAINH